MVRYDFIVWHFKLHHLICYYIFFVLFFNSICEICGATAVNIAGEQAIETNSNSNSNSTAASGAITSIPAAPIIPVESRSCWHSRRIMNFLLACMVFAFVVSWLFHFKILS